MKKVIIYPNERGGIAIVYPAPNCGISLEEIARKDVPAGLPHIIIDEADVPSDLTFFDAFEADFSEPHGHGIGANAWFIEQYKAKIATLNPLLDAAEIAQLNTMIAIQQAEMQA